MSDELWTYSNRVGSFWKDPIVIKKGQQQKTIDTHYDIRKGSICYVLNQLTECSLQSWFSYSFPCRNTSLSCDSLCSRNFQNVKLRLHDMDIFHIYCYSDLCEIKLWYSKRSQNVIFDNSRVSEIVKMASFDIQILAKLIPHKIKLQINYGT